MADPKKPTASNPPPDELEEERDEDEEESDEEESDEEESDEEESDEDDSEEDEDLDEEDDADEDEEDDDDDADDEDDEDLDDEEDDDDDARATTRSQRPASGGGQDLLPDWAPWAVLGTLLVGGLGGGLFFSLSGSPEAAPEAAATAAATTTAASPTSQASARRRPNPMGSAEPQGESISASHVLIAYKGSMRADPKITRSKEEAQKRAQEVVKKAKAGGDFGSLAAEYSDEPRAAQRKGDLGSFTKNRMVKPFADAAFQLKPGQISDVVETPFGFHVIKRTQ